MTSAGLEVLVLALIPAIFWGLTPIFDKRGMAAGGGSVQASLVVVVVDSALYWLAIAAVYGRSAFSGLTLEVLTVFAFAGVLHVLPEQRAVDPVATLSLMAALGLEGGRIAIVDPLVATAPLFTLLFAAVLLRDLERVMEGVVAGAVLVVVGAVLITV